MTVRNDKVEGDLEVVGQLRFAGMVTGNIQVRTDGGLQLQGMCNGDVLVETAATAIIDGTVGGSVLSYGTTEIRGTVHGNVRKAGGSLLVTPGANVRGHVSEA